MKRKIVSFMLCLSLIFGMLPLTAFAHEDEEGNKGGVTLDKEDAFPAIRDAFAEYLVNEVHIEKDDYLGIPVDVYVYAKVGKGSEIAPVLQYVINTNTERVGTESDVSILSDLIEEYIVVVVDYRNNSLTTPINVDQSVHRIHLATAKGTYLTYVEDGATKKLNILTQADNWVIPAGYRLMRDIPYYNFIDNAAEGTLGQIMKVWNEDFGATTHANVVISWGQKTTEDGRLVFNDANGTRCYENTAKNGYVYEDGTAVSGEVVPEYKKLREGASYVDETARTAAVKDTWAEDWWDCCKKDGTPLDMNLYYDVMYPSEPKEGTKIPVLSMAVSRQSTTGNWFAAADNPEYIGAALFDGYAGFLYEYPYVPMARRDHYGYFSDSPLFPDTTKTDWKYGVSKWMGKNSSRAAIRAFRYLCATNSALEALDPFAMGVICISKTGYNVFLGNENPDVIPETQNFGANEQEDFKNKPQPFLTYDDGTPIPSGVQAVYTVSGSNSENMLPGFSPVYVSVGMQDSGAYQGFYKTVRLNAKYLDLESVHYELPLLGHAYLVGMCEKYNVDTYASVMSFFDYHVAGRAASIEYITPLNGSTNVATDEEIVVKFNASVSLSNVEKYVKIVNAKTGKEATGTWSAEYGRTEWTFRPDGLDGGATYLVYVPEDTTTEDGRTMKASKTAAFVTVPEKLSVRGTYASADGTTTVTDGNTVYIQFNAPNTEGSTSEALRFNVTNERAAQSLSVYAVTKFNAEDPSASTLGEMIGNIKIAGAGTYEIDISDYLKTLPEGAKPTFALVAERTVGTVTLHNETYNSANDTSTLKSSSTTQATITWSDLYNRDGEGGSLQIVRTGSSYFFNNALGLGNNNKSTLLTEEDFGRLFRVRMSVLVPEGEHGTHYFKTFIGYGALASTGIEQYVDWNDTTYVNVHPNQTPGKWMDIEFYYQIDDPDYIKEGIKKCYLVTSHYPGTLYIDNYSVEEITSAIDLCAEFAPSIVTHPSVAVDTSLLDAILAKSGEAGDIFFGSENGLIVSGQSVNMTSSGAEKTYIKLDLSTLDATKPTVLTMNVTDTVFGEIAVYGITDKALGESWSSETISWQNAPANDRFGFGVDADLTTRISTISVEGIGAYTLDVTDFCFAMKDKGAESATIILVLANAPGELISSCDFENGKMTYAASTSGGTTLAEQTEELAFPDGGTGAYKVVANSTHARIRFNLLGRVVTKSDVGTRYLVRYHIYSVDGGKYNQCIRPQTAELQSNTVTVEAGKWVEQSYSFTITEDMVDYTPYFTLIAAKLGSLTGTEDAFFSTFYVDNIRLYDGTGNISFSLVEDTREPIVSADFDATTLAVSNSGGGTGKIGVGPNDIAHSGTNTMYWTATGSTQRPMLQIFDTVTEDMIGKQYELNYMFYATGSGYFNSYPRMVVRIDNANKAYEFRTDANPCKIIYAEANTWQKVTTVFTVTQEMFDLTVNPNPSLRVAFEPYGMNASATNPVTCYVDDLNVYSLAEEDEEAEVKLPYTKTYDFEDSAQSSATIASGFEAKNGSKIYIETGNDRTGKGTSTLKIIANANYNRVLFKTVIDDIGYSYSSDKTNALYTGESWAEGATEGCLTSEDLGRKFRISFYLKSEVAGLISVAIGGHRGSPICTTKQSYEIPGGYEWTKVVYEFEINQSMIDNRYASFLIMLSDFSFTDDKLTLRTMYLDDFTSVELVPGFETPAAVTDSAVISNRKLVSDDTLVVDRAPSHESVYNGIHASLLRFEKDSYASASKGELVLKLKNYAGQKVSVWGLTMDPGNDLTYNSISALSADGTVSPTAVFGGAPLASFVADEQIKTVNIKDYIRYRATNELLFLITSESDGTTEYLNLDFDARIPALGTDVTSTADLSITGGALNVAGNAVTFKNILDAKNSAFINGKSYVVTVKVSADVEKNFTVSLDGSTLSANNTLQNGVISFTFTVPNTGISSITVSADSAGFSIDSCVVSENDALLTIEQASAEIHLADSPISLSNIEGVYASMTLSEDIAFSIYLPENLLSTLSSLTLDGKEIDAEGLSVANGMCMFTIRDIAIKDLAKYHLLTFNYKSGISRTFEINAMEYLANLITADEANSELRRLVYALVEYAREAQMYFLGDNAFSYNVMYTALLDEYARYNTEKTPALTSPAIGESGKVITDAAINLYDAPEYLFRIDSAFTGTITLTQGEITEVYTVENGLADGEDVIVFRPSGAYAAANTITVTTVGTVNATGEYGLGSYRSAAVAANLTKVVEVVDSLARYIEAAKTYEASTNE